MSVKHLFKTLGLALVAVLALSAVAVASASAGKPEYLMKSSKVTFTSSGAKATLETESGAKVVCSANSGSGEITGAKSSAKVSLTFTGCKENSETGPACTTEGDAEGTIKTKSLKGLLAYTYPSKTTAEGRETGNVLSAESGEVMSEFKCSGVPFTVSGSVIGVVTPLNKSVTSGTMTFRQKAGKQEPSEYEAEGSGKGTSALMTTTIFGFAPSTSGEEATGSVKFAEAVEVMA